MKKLLNLVFLISSVAFADFEFESSYFVPTSTRKIQANEEWRDARSLSYHRRDGEMCNNLSNDNRHCMGHPSEDKNKSDLTYGQLGFDKRFIIRGTIHINLIDKEKFQTKWSSFLYSPQNLHSNFQNRYHGLNLLNIPPSRDLGTER